MIDWDSSPPQAAAVVERVGQKIREQIADPHMQFEFHVVESWDSNVVCLQGTWIQLGQWECLPQRTSFIKAGSETSRFGGKTGGKMVVHSGLVDTFTGDEDALAAVLFHEAVHGQLREPFLASSGVQLGWLIIA